MASKLQNISALSNEIGKSLADYENWTAFFEKCGVAIQISVSRPNLDLCPTPGRNGLCKH